MEHRSAWFLFYSYVSFKYYFKVTKKYFIIMNHCLSLTFHPITINYIFNTNCISYYVKRVNSYFQKFFKYFDK